MPNACRSAAPFALATVLVVLALLPMPARAQNADTILARHVAARGGREAMAAIRTLAYRRGQYEEPGFRGSGRSAMMLMRPHFKLVGDPTLEQSFMEGYDGAAWEFYRNPGFVIRTVGEPSAAIRHFADIDGPLFDYAAKGHRLEAGTDTVLDGRPVHRLVLTMLDGFRIEWMIDAQTYLDVATRQCAPVHAVGPDVCSETRLSDHRPVAGVLLPHRFTGTRIGTGEVLSTMQWSAIEANVDIPIEWFSPPEFERTPLQSFAEHLFLQRADTSALRWTYATFRRAHPDVETRAAVEAIGLQMVKVGDYDGAVALLGWNAADHPDSDDAARALRRALDARAETP